MRDGARLLVVLCLAAAGCGGGPGVADDTGEWIRETTTEGNVTTIRTLGGSVWGGTARLEEEASIGVEQGPEEQMLGRGAGLAAGDDAVYVLDSQLPAVRVYDMEGNHLRDVGREGQGPGEFTQPMDVAIGPDGRIFVRERARVAVFTPEGEPGDTLPIDSGFHSSTPMTVTHDGEIHFPDLVDHDAEARGLGARHAPPEPGGTDRRHRPGAGQRLGAAPPDPPDQRGGSGRARAGSRSTASTSSTSRGATRAAWRSRSTPASPTLAPSSATTW